MLKYFFVAIIVTLLFVAKIFKNKLSKNKFFILKAVLIVLLIEVTIFNINSYRTDFGNLKVLGVFGDELEEKINITNDNTQYIYLSNLDTKVKSIYVELEGLEEDETVDYDIFYSDESTSDRYLASKTYCEGVEKTKYSVISLSRKM